MICLGIERVSGFEVASIEKFGMFAHVPVDVVSLNETAIRVGVCEEKCATVTIFGLQVIIIELLHDQLRYFKYGKDDGDWLVYIDALTCFSHHGQVLVYYGRHM